MIKKENTCFYQKFIPIMRHRNQSINFIWMCSKNIQKILLENKKQKAVDKFTRVLCLLFAGFLIGNLFGTFLYIIRKLIPWDGMIVFFLVSMIEILSYHSYHNKNKPLFCALFVNKKYAKLCTKRKAFINLCFLLDPKMIKRSFWRSLNFLKIGLMIGFFIDAFKVGS